MSYERAWRRLTFRLIPITILAMVLAGWAVSYTERRPLSSLVIWEEVEHFELGSLDGVLRTALGCDDPSQTTYRCRAWRLIEEPT